MIDDKDDMPELLELSKLQLQEGHNLLDSIIAQQDVSEIDSLCGPDIVVDPIVKLKEQQWQELVGFLNKWFYKPDIEALRICLSIYAAHTYLDEEPIWLFVIGVSGSGKTSIAVRAIEYLANVYRITDLTTKSFSSGFGKDNGLLGMLTKENNGNGFFTFPDFTTIMSKSDYVVDEIQGQIRSITDGKYYDKKGGRENPMWEGKVSAIAAVTPALEDRWALNRVLGERFLYVRWRSGDSRKTADFAIEQANHKKEINEEFGRLVRQYVDLPLGRTDLPANLKNAIGGLASIVSLLRTVVRKNKKGSVISKDGTEMPTRIANGLHLCMKGSASLARRKIANIDDLEIARKLAFDTIPVNRYKVFKAFVDSPYYEVKRDELIERTELWPMQVDRVIEEFEKLDIIKITNGISYDWLKLSPSVIRDVRDSLLLLPLSSLSTL